MSRRVALVAAAAEAQLVGADGSFEWGEATTVGPGARPNCDVVVELAGARAGESEATSVDWLDRAPEAATAARRCLVIAPGGERLWRRRPLPVGQACFDLPLPRRPSAVVVGPDSPRRRQLVERASSVGVEMDVADRLSLSVLGRASSVALLAETDEVVSPWSFCVLAARRLLLTPAHQIGFGLRHGIDHLQFNDPDELASLLRSAQVHPNLFEPLRVSGEDAAERRRTATVLGTLVGDLEIEGRLARAGKEVE